MPLETNGATYRRVYENQTYCQWCDCRPCPFVVTMVHRFCGIFSYI